MCRMAPMPARGNDGGAGSVDNGGAACARHRLRWKRKREKHSEDSRTVAWVRRLRCPVIRLDGTRPVADNVALVPRM